MIFHKTYQQVLDGSKTQTRRPVKKYQLAIGGIDSRIHDIDRVEVLKPSYYKGRLLWEVGRTYAIQLGRGKKSLGRIKIVEIRIEKVQAISCIDMIAEGLKTNLRHIDATMHLLDQWRDLWNSLYAGTKFAWEKNPDVWVLEFELVEKY